MSFSQEEYQKQIMSSVPEGNDGPLSTDDLEANDEDLDESGIDEDTTEVDVEEEPGEDSSANNSYDRDTVSKIVRTRVATYEKRLERMTPYKNAVDKICEITGLNTEQLVERLGTMSEEEQARVLGMTPQQVAAARTARTNLQATEGKTRTLQKEMELMKLKADVHFKDVDLFKEEIDDMLEDNPKMSLKQAYLAVKGELALTAAQREGEDRATTRQVVNAQKKLVKSGAAGPGTARPKISNEIIALAKKVGMDPAEYAAYQGIDNLDSYRGMKGKKK